MTGLGVQRAFYSACLTWFWETRVLIGAIHTHLPCKLPRGSLGADEVTTSFWEGRGSSEWFLVIGLKVRLHKILDFQISKRTLELYVPKPASASP